MEIKKEQNNTKELKNSTERDDAFMEALNAEDLPKGLQESMAKTILWKYTHRVVNIAINTLAETCLEEHLVPLYREIEFLVGYTYDFFKEDSGLASVCNVERDEFTKYWMCCYFQCCVNTARLHYTDISIGDDTAILFNLTDSNTAMVEYFKEKAKVEDPEVDFNEGAWLKVDINHKDVDEDGERRVGCSCSVMHPLDIDYVKSYKEYMGDAEFTIPEHMLEHLVNLILAEMGQKESVYN